jgi:hypothetical protein
LTSFHRVALGVNDGERADLAVKGAAGKRLTYRQPPLKLTSNGSPALPPLPVKAEKAKTKIRQILADALGLNLGAYVARAGIV